MQVKMISTLVDLYFPLLRLGNLYLKQRKIQNNQPRLKSF